MNTMHGQKYLWKLPSLDHDQALSLAASFNLSVPLAQTLITRGMTDKQVISSYLFSSFEQDVTHAAQLKDAQKAVDRIMYAVDNQEKILIFGDYDVDGITSSAMMMLCLLPLGAQVNFYLPHRVRDGYGLSEKIVKKAAENGYRVIITVDNGISAFEPASLAKKLGIDLIITDHHRPHDHVPEAFAIVNPNQTDCPFPFKGFAGVGVTFKVLSLLYEKLQKQLPDKVYELLLLGTIADVVPLTRENRYWVRHCLQHVNAADSASLQMLKQNGKVTRSRINASDIGFAIAPQINALGRLEDPRQGVKFLIGTDESVVQEVGKVLLDLNQTRKEIERLIVQEIEQEITSGRIDLTKENIIMAASSHWPPGVIGLVAGRLMHQYGKPALLFHMTDKGIAKGSCRSIPEFNMFNALQGAEHLLISFGGHSVAAGLSLKKENIPFLKEYLEELLVKQVDPAQLRPKLTIDAQVTLNDLNKKFIDDLAFFEPFGNSNVQPAFVMHNVTILSKPQLLKDAHVKCQLFADGVIKPVIFFNRPELFHALIDHGENSFSVAGQVTENVWEGRSNVELQGLDIAFPAKGE